MKENYITFDNTRYHLNSDMQAWCSCHFGRGNWTNEPIVKDWQGIKFNWTIHSMFGNTTFCFRRARDLTFFLLKWA